MKKLISIIISLFFVYNIYSQNLISLEHNGTSSFYTSINNAVYYAVSGDTIYIPGDSYDISTLIIDKKLAIYGVGHYPDSTSATFRTQLNGSIILKNDADGTYLTGFYLSGNITFGTNATDQEVNNVTIIRCNIGNLSLSYDGSSTTTSNSLIITENVIRGYLYGGYAQQVIVEKNIINYPIWYLNGNVIFNHNIFLYSYIDAGLFRTISNILFENNIFTGYLCSYCNTKYYPSNCIFNNNVFVTNISFPWVTTNVGVDNVVNQALSDVFINQSGYTFNYDHDYHLQSTFLVGIGAGTDGSDIGIYGTNAPYKDGAVPNNPHIQYKVISTGTDADGNLKVNIKVAGQNR